MLGAGIVIVVVAALIAFAGGVLFLITTLNTQRQMSRLMDSLASKFNGYVTGTSHFPKVVFSRDDASFIVQSKTIKGIPYLTISTSWPDATFRAKFFPETISDTMKNFIGMQDIKIGEPRFDSRFVVQSNDVNQLIKFLRPEIQSKIYAMGDQAVLNISGGAIRLERKIDYFSNEAQAFHIVRQFVDAFLVMRTASFDSASSIEFQAISFDLEDAVCMICGDKIIARRVVCRTCKTPHHQECWEYLSLCSTYGCGQTRYRIPTKKQPMRIR